LRKLFFNTPLLFIIKEFALNLFFFLGNAKYIIEILAFSYESERIPAFSGNAAKHL